MLAEVIVVKIVSVVYRCVVMWLHILVVSVMNSGVSSAVLMGL